VSIMKSASIPVLLIALTSLVACGARREEATAAKEPAAANPPPVKMETDNAMDKDIPQVLLASIKADAAKRTGKSAADITVVSAEAVTWRDASLGCPQPGMMSAQVLTPGYRVKLSAGREELVYHSATAGRFLVCPADRAQAPLPREGSN
jgi:hypothetical protein